MKKYLIFILALVLLASCRSIKVPDYYVCAYVWPSCHDDSLGRTNWEEGIGEWEVIKKGNPRFEGHYQPKEPLWGYEMDNDPAVVGKWIETALSHGVNTFIYDWYWFDNGPYLESALNDGFLKAPGHEKMNFYIMWANHNVKHNYWNYHKWGDDDSLLWDGAVDRENFEIIVERVIRQYFTQPNYVKINGCPVFAIFSASNFKKGLGGEEQAKEAIAYMREKVKAAGFPDVHIQMTDGNIPEYTDERLGRRRKSLESIDADSYAGYNMGPYNNDYETCAKGSEVAIRAWHDSLGVPVFPVVSIGWDDTPRFPAKGYDDVMHNQSPELFEKYLRGAKAMADEFADSQPKFVMINAWNEWVEGSYLLPDKKYGFAYLDAVKNVFCNE